MLQFVVLLAPLNKEMRIIINNLSRKHELKMSLYLFNIFHISLCIVGCS